MEARSDEKDSTRTPSISGDALSGPLQRRPDSQTNDRAFVAPKGFTQRVPQGFEKKGDELKVRVEDPLVFDNIAMRLDASLNGPGLAGTPDDVVQRYVDEGRLLRLLQDRYLLFP